MKKQIVVVTGGGTGGHLFAALSLVEYLKKIEMKPVFIGSELGIEKIILKNHQTEYFLLHTKGFSGKNLPSKIASAASMLKETIRTLHLLSSLRPVAVIGFGGYTTIPVLSAAFLLGLKTAIVEQNSVPGNANKLLSAMVTHIFVNFEETNKYFKNKGIVVGNPMRFKVKPKIKNPRKLQIRIGVIGGSRGARKINRAMMDFAEITQLEIKVIHQTGKEDYNTVKHYYANAKPTWEVVDFIEDMDSFYKNLDLIISRAGASTLSEIACYAVPSILVPYPYAIHNHQLKNAMIFEKAGASVVIEDKDLSGKKLESVVSSLTPEQLKEMSKRAGRLCKNDACERIMSVLLGT